jgi:XTP/dITP diphosphohydrolase
VSQLDRAVQIMDRLRSPGGCPWDAEQTHATLARYLLEETYELLEAIETGDLHLLREELGDLLLQVLFHARLTEELPPGQAFGIEDVAADLGDKLVRRHPHVFAADAERHRASAEQLNETWEKQKAVEKGRTSATEGVPLAQPALSLAAKLVARAGRAGIDPDPAPTSALGEQLFVLVRSAVAAGEDPESALRETARAYRDAILRAEGTGMMGR